MNTTTYLITAYHDASGQEAVYSLNITVYLDTDFDGLPDDVPANPRSWRTRTMMGTGPKMIWSDCVGRIRRTPPALPRTELASTCTSSGPPQDNRTRVQAADSSSFRSSP